MSTQGVLTDKKGTFYIPSLSVGIYHLEVSFIGYIPHLDTLQINSKTPPLSIVMRLDTEQLGEVVVHDRIEDRLEQQETRVEAVSGVEIREGLAGSLMQSLEHIPGVKSMLIGSGQSKPVIRGLSFNRVVVMENGIKHQGQQWGAEHGLEIDQYSIHRVKVIKGAASVEYGSDAIGGVIALSHETVPISEGVKGSLDLTGKSNNDLIGLSAHVSARHAGFFVASRFTLTDYADFRVPTDKVTIYSYRVPLSDGLVRNTAGKEQVFHLTMGWKNSRLTTQFHLNYITSESGFFANAAGRKPLNADVKLHDANFRDILLPSQQVTHWKLIHETHIDFSVRQRLQMIWGYQSNKRQERSIYSSHSYMPSQFPSSLPFSSDLEKAFEKNTLSVNLKWISKLYSRTTITGGVSSEIQNNSISGRTFLIPAFLQWTWGAFVFGKHDMGSAIRLSAGLRYDRTQLQTDRYQDWYASPVLNSIERKPIVRANELHRTFQNLSGAIGFRFKQGDWLWDTHVGKSFRIPLPQELGANGNNRHFFRQEIGDSTLSPEISYQWDIGMQWRPRLLVVRLNPFINYFPNYIYLNPSYFKTPSIGQSQPYEYTQSKVFRYGGELDVNYQIFSAWELGMTTEYIYSEQLSGPKEGYTLPFSPPATALFRIVYTPHLGKFLKRPYISAKYRVAAAQENIVPPEEKTPGYQVVHLAAGTVLAIGKQTKLSIGLQIRNLLDTKYFNHTSYYRIIEMPEVGRNVVLNLTLFFNSN